MEGYSTLQQAGRAEIASQLATLPSLHLAEMHDSMADRAETKREAASCNHQKRYYLLQEGPTYMEGKCLLDYYAEKRDALSVQCALGLSMISLISP